MPEPDLLSSLQPPTLQSVMAPLDTLGQVGVGLAGIGRAQNPFLAQAQEQFKQQVEMMRLRQSVEIQRMEKAKLGINLYQDVLRDPQASQDAKTRALKGWTDSLQGLGISVDPAFSQSLLNRNVSLDDVEKIGAALARGVPPDLIKQQFPSLSSSTLQAATSLSQNPQFLKAHNMKTPNELRQEATKTQADDLTLLLKQYGVSGIRGEIILRRSVSEYGKTFGDLTGLQREKLLTATEGMGVPKTTLVKNALAEMGLNPEQVQDPAVIQQALTRHTARVKRDQLEAAGIRGQLTTAGAMYRKALTDSQQDFSRLARVESLERDMIRLVKEGRELGLTTNPKFVNFAQQELASWTASGGTGKLTKQADWVRRFGIVDAQFAVVAQAFERITGNRLAQNLVTLARGFHPKITDPYEVQKGVVMELHRKLKENRAIATQDLARAQNLYDQVLKLTGTGVQNLVPDEAAIEDQPEPEAK